MGRDNIAMREVTVIFRNHRLLFAMPTCFDDNIAIVGGVDTVTRKLHDLYDVTGGFGTLLMIAHDWDDKAVMRKSMELMAKEVVSQLP